MQVIELDNPIDLECPYCHATVQLVARKPVQGGATPLGRNVPISAGEPTPCPSCGQRFAIMVALTAWGEPIRPQIRLVRRQGRAVD